MRGATRRRWQIPLARETRIQRTSKYGIANPDQSRRHLDPRLVWAAALLPQVLAKSGAPRLAQSFLRGLHPPRPEKLAHYPDASQIITLPPTQGDGRAKLENICPRSPKSARRGTKCGAQAKAGQATGQRRDRSRQRVLFKFSYFEQKAKCVPHSVVVSGCIS